MDENCDIASDRHAVENAAELRYSGIKLDAGFTTMVVRQSVKQFDYSRPRKLMTTPKRDGIAYLFFDVWDSLPINKD